MDKPLKSVTHGQCDARPTVTFPSAGRHRPLTGAKLYCLVTEAHVCEQLAQGCYLKVERPGVEPATFCVASQHHNHYTTRLTRMQNFRKLPFVAWGNIGFRSFNFGVLSPAPQSQLLYETPTLELGANPLKPQITGYISKTVKDTHIVSIKVE